MSTTEALILDLREDKAPFWGEPKNRPTPTP